MTKFAPTETVRSAAPLTGQRAREIQAFGSLVPMPIALAENTRRASAINLNQLLADTITLRHTARSRDGFARGALRAARWLAGKKGFFEFREIVDELP